MSKNNRKFWESAAANDSTFIQYYNRLMEMAVTRIEWKNLPETVDARFLELSLFTDGKALYFNDDVLGDLALRCTAYGKFNIYNIPTRRRAYASNGYQANRTEDDSVIIYNNYIRTPSKLDVEMFAMRLYNIDRTIDVNVNAQKTPVLIQCSENQRLTFENIYMKWQGNMPLIMASDDLRADGFKVLSTGAPYVAGQLYTLKTQIWNEAMTYLGITNLSSDKKERMITDEVNKNLGGTYSSRYSALEARRQAADKINRMFGTNIEVDFRDFDEQETAMPQIGGIPA